VQRLIRKSVAVNASRQEVWKAWTTEEGVKGFFAPDANVELAIGGAYEMLFDPEAPVGSQGGEGLRILSYLPEEMLSFEWNAPPEFPTVRAQKTWVVVQLGDTPAQTKVQLTHLGWEEGAEWNRVFDYFQQAWNIVLRRLQKRFTDGPIDWENLYRPSS